MKLTKSLQITLTAMFGVNLFLFCGVSEADSIFVSNSGNNTVEKFDTMGNRTVFVSSGLNYPAGLAFDTAGNLYVASAHAGTILKFDSTGQGSLFASSGLGSPAGLAFHNGYLYVANDWSNNIIKYDSSGNGTVFASSGIDNPEGLAFDGSGNLYVANVYTGTIMKYDSNGQGTLFASLGSVQPYGLAFDHSGNLYVANAAANTIEVFDSSGNGTMFASSGINNPVGLAFDSTSNLYVAEFWANTITKYDATGRGSIFANADLDNPIYIAIQSGQPTNCAPVPSGLVGWWKGEGNALDSAGTNDATLAGNATANVSGRVGQAFSLDGVNAVVNCGNNSFFDFSGGSADFTIECWVKPTAFPSGSTGIASKSQGNFDGWVFGMYYDGRLLFSGVGSWDVNSGSAVLATGVWSHVAVTHTGSTYKLYCNGSQVFSGAGGSWSGSVAQLRFGPNPPAQNYNGLLDEISIYNRALTPDEIAAVYAAGSKGKCVPPCIPHAATATAEVVNGFVVGAPLTDGGCGYTNTPTVRVIGDVGSGAEAVAVVSNGIVVAVNILDAGYGYSDMAVIVVQPPFIPEPTMSGTLLNFGPFVTPLLELLLNDLSPYDNYQLEFKPTAGGAWSNYGNPFTPTADGDTQYVPASGTVGFFRVKYVP